MRVLQFYNWGMNVLFPLLILENDDNEEIDLQSKLIYLHQVPIQGYEIV
jgi:hypothetical protein